MLRHLDMPGRVQYQPQPRTHTRWHFWLTEHVLWRYSRPLFLHHVRVRGSCRCHSTFHCGNRGSWRFCHIPGGAQALVLNLWALPLGLSPSGLSSEQGGLRRLHGPSREQAEGESPFRASPSWAGGAVLRGSGHPGVPRRGPMPGQHPNTTAHQGCALTPGRGAHLRPLRLGLQRKGAPGQGLVLETRIQLDRKQQTSRSVWGYGRRRLHQGSSESHWGN